MNTTKIFDWDSIALAYYSGVPITRLCRNFGLTSRIFYYHTKKMGWLRKHEITSDKQLKYRQKYMIRQSFAVLTGKITKACERLELYEDLSTQQAGKEAYTLKTLIASLEQLMQLEKQIREEETQTTGATNDKAEHLRSSLAERLTRLETEPD